MHGIALAALVAGVAVFALAIGYLLGRSDPSSRPAVDADDVAELRRRVIVESGLGEPVPRVSVDVAMLLADLVVELERAAGA